MGDEIPAKKVPGVPSRLVWQTRYVKELLSIGELCTKIFIDTIKPILFLFISNTTGISWHISVVYRRLNGVLQWQGYIHIIQSCTQGSTAVVTIMQDVLKTIKTEYPEIKSAYFRQDNAACYHSSETIKACPIISQATGVNVARIDFSDPQGGKGAADRLAATCKAHIRVYINEGNDVTTAQHLKDAILSYEGIEGVRVTATDTINEVGLFENPKKITGISKLNNFSFTSEGTRAWQAYGIGSGKELNVEETTTGKI